MLLLAWIAMIRSPNQVMVLELATGPALSAFQASKRANAWRGSKWPQPSDRRNELVMRQVMCGLAGAPWLALRCSFAHWHCQRGLLQKG